ncbi:MAG TPA: formylglycine-generating enzyme family protein [Candidatus Hydrogenedentes bacterium]|nr:formylglycine-generating enzyme family protein [Candidatus Hydrogenedentota bacterium]HOV74249.1 formylglycine-generating enzyme family protein [Candidatus Hydrogenedentota bacterium]HPC15057.1 formylglycine-generating enzyme family protein [Candidatus Hydrogenedentota bacterium]HRT19082.1 formylglycine-generating enzyme family protein [Candidatus Hydrogenedentota bacterium]HRT64011.1 formylglycine-generating enzyme family protein [Candidatus Hydrogenedentota bacterium]
MHRVNREIFRPFFPMLAALLLPVWAMAQVPAPSDADLTEQTFRSGLGGGSSVMLVNNGEFKKFRPGMKFEARQEGAPVLMTPREAGDYAAFLGKRLGTDFFWKQAPRKETGYLIVAAPNLNLESLPSVEWPPKAPEGMIYIPERPFIMGSDKGDADEKPQRTATTGPFFMDKYEVSNAEFKAVFPEFEFPQGQENVPAVVNWRQAADYAAKVGKRLPTEAEWEKAARGWDGRTFPWGEVFDPSLVCAGDTTPRGGSIAAAASPYGCMDMAGGVWEWTADWYQPYPENDSPSEDYGETFKVLRGGSTGADAAALRTSFRYYLPPDTTGGLRVGFRCAKDIE